jgi:aryl-alcohol dehydrogenase-like predicted oxidoreductase
LADELGVTAAQLSIAFCLAHPAITSVLFGCTSQKQLEENLGALAVHERYGASLRDRVDEFWFDRDRIDPEASWAERPMSFPAPAAR